MIQDCQAQDDKCSTVLVVVGFAVCLLLTAYCYCLGWHISGANRKVPVPASVALFLYIFCKVDIWYWEWSPWFEPSETLVMNNASHPSHDWVPHVIESVSFPTINPVVAHTWKKTDLYLGRVAPAIRNLRWLLHTLAQHSKPWKTWADRRRA